MYVGCFGGRFDIPTVQGWREGAEGKCKMNLAALGKRKTWWGGDIGSCRKKLRGRNDATQKE